MSSLAFPRHVRRPCQAPSGGAPCGSHGAWALPSSRPIAGAGPPLVGHLLHRRLGSASHGPIPQSPRGQVAK
eukprot:9794825-Alexandrium_andersonii.AAC.1